MRFAKTVELRSAPLLLSLALLLAVGAAAAAEAPYTVEAGDDCKQVAARFWTTVPSKVGLERFHGLNPQLGAQPHHLLPGMILKVAAPEADAHVTFLKPAVNKRVLKQPEWQEASRGDGLFRLDEINTLKGAGAELTFRDLSAVALDENALIVIYGDQPAPKKEQKSGALELVRGDAQIKLSDLRGSKPFEVSMPAGSASLRKGGRAGVGVDEAKTSLVAVYAGAAEVAAQGKQVAVASGFGTRVLEGKSPEPPTPLPVAPAWDAGVASAAFAMPSSPARLQLAWKPVAGAVSYRAQVARDSQFRDRVSDQKLDATAPLSTEAELQPGLYFGRVIALDAKGLAGSPSPLLKLAVLSVRPVSGHPLPGAAAVSSVGELRLVLDGVPSALLSVDDREPQEIRLPALIGLLQPGQHQVRASSGAPGKPGVLRCTVEQPTAKVSFGPPAADGALPVEVALLDPAGQPLALPKDDDGGAALLRLLKQGVVQLRDRTSGVVPAVLDGELLKATLAPNAGKSVRVVWAGTPIGEGHADGP